MAERQSAPPQVTPSTSRESRTPEETCETAGPSQPKRVGNQPAPDSEHAHVEARTSTSQESRSTPPSETPERPPDESSETAGPSQPQQAEAAPEDVWMPIIDDLYPNLLSQTSFHPPLHFNRSPHNVVIIAGIPALVRENPRLVKGYPKLPPHSPPAQVAGTVCLENPPNIQPVHVPESDQQADRALQRCLQALSEIPSQVMMVISRLKFQKYLIGHTNPLYTASIAQLPSIQHPSISENIADGECDIVVIHRQYGLIIGKVASVGGYEGFHSQTPDKQTQLITRSIGKAPKQLDSQETALRHLVSDLPPIRITRTLLLPNISSGQLQSFLSATGSHPLLQALCRTLSLPADVSRAAGHCLCEEDVQQPDTWWQTLHGSGQDQHMSDDVYRRLVARFCGPATTVDIPTAGLPRKVVRSYSEAVAETGLRFSSLNLTPRQVALLNTQPELPYVYLQGPPGTGKTVVLLLKALQWVQQGRQVVIVSGRDDSRAVSLLLEEQLRSMAGPAAANAIQRLCCDFGPYEQAAVTSAVIRAAVTRAVTSDVTSLQQVIGPGPVLVICDEFDLEYGSGHTPWLTEVRHRLPAVTVWTAGVWTHGGPGTRPLPSWVRVETLLEPLRCPPSVTALLQQTVDIQGNLVPQYTAPQVAVATQGPPVQRQQHNGQPGHSGGRPWQCVTCADVVADVIRQLRVGQPGQPLQYRDVWIVYGGPAPPAGDVLVGRLQQHHGLPVAVASDPPSEDEVRELALAVTDHIMVTGSNAVQGLERRVVVVLGGGGNLPAMSRCSSSLYTID